MTWLDDFERWLQTHEAALNLATVWAIVVALTVWSLVKMLSRYVLAGSVDQGDVGRSLKSAKSSEIVMGCALSTLYGLSLVAYYLDWTPELWTRLAIRGFLIAGTVGAALAGLRFARALWRETLRGPDDPPDPPSTVSGLRPREDKWRWDN